MIDFHRTSRRRRRGSKTSLMKRLFGEPTLGNCSHHGLRSFVRLGNDSYELFNHGIILNGIEIR